MSDVFISYKREDRPRVERIALGLQKQNIKVWFDAQTRISASFIEEINNELNACKCAIVVWSKRSIASRFVRSEAYHAFERERLIPVMIESVQVPVPFNELQAVDFRKWDSTFTHSAWADLFEAVQSYCQTARKQTSIKDVDIPDESEDERPPQSTEPVRDLVVSTLRNANQPITSAALAQIVRSSFPQQIGPFDWFGHKRFRDLLAAFQRDGVEFDPKPPGLITLKAKVRGKTQAVPLVKTAASKSGAMANGVGDPDDFPTRLFETTEAPLLTPKQYTAVFRSIADAARKGKRTITDITKSARDLLAELKIPVSRDKISFIYKGALIGGAKLDDKFLNADKIGYAFAQAVHDQCGGFGWEMTPHERDELLGVLGIAPK